MFSSSESELSDSDSTSTSSELSTTDSSTLSSSDTWSTDSDDSSNLICIKIKSSAVIRQRERVMTWVRVNCLLNNTNNIVLNDCMKDVIQLFGGNKNLLFFITQNAKTETLQSIHQIIKKQKLKYQDKKNTKSAKIESEETDEPIVNDLFHYLPNESISHICGYLNRKNIKNFKQTCRQNAIISMEEMNKVSVGVLNYCNLLSDDNDLCHLRKTIFNFSRHSPNKRFYALYDEWDKQYNILEDNQLIFKAKTTKRQFELVDSKKVRLEQIKKCTYLICDHRKTVILNQDKAIKFDPMKHSYEQLKNYKLMILEYFDIGKQTTNIVQFILYEKNKVSLNTILDYIEYKFITCDDNHDTSIEYKWYNELKLILKQMCYDKDQPKLIMFSHERYCTMIAMVDKYPLKNCATLQINYNHPWFSKTNKFDETKVLCKQKMDKFHQSAEEFCKNIQFINIKYSSDKTLLKSTIENYFDSNFDENMKNIFENDLNKIYKNIDKPPKIKCSATSSSNVLRMAISKLFGNIIDPKYIEVRRVYYDNWNKWNEPIGDTSSICYKFRLYDQYDVESMNDTALYNVRIFDPMNCPYPYDFDEAGKIISIRYKKKFVIKDFVNHIFETINNSTNHMLYSQYEDIMQLFDNKRIKCILAKKNARWSWTVGKQGVTEFNQYSLNGTYSISGRNDSRFLDLYMVRIKPKQSSKTIKLNIKFISNKKKFNAKTDINTIDDLEYVGLPLTVWINENDTMQYIIDEYLLKTKQFLLFCYRIKVKDKIISIPESKRSNYRPYHQFIKNHPHDFIIFKCKKQNKNDTSKCLPKYSKPILT